MLRIPFLTFFLVGLVLVTACTKHDDAPTYPLNHTDSLLIGTPWALQKSDTVYLDAAGNVIGQQTFIPPNCSSQLHLAFYKQKDWQIFTQCSQPAFTPKALGDHESGWSWNSTGGHLFFRFQSGDPRAVSYLSGNDSIITLTKDSLVLYLDTRQQAPFSYSTNVVLSGRQLLITDTFTH